MADNKIVKLDQLSHYKALQDAAILKTLAEYAKETSIPKNVSQLSNDSKYQTESDVVAKGYQTASDVNGLINAALADFTTINFEIVTSLPSTGVSGTFYLISNGGNNGNSYDEYVWITNTNKFEKIGTTDVDLSDYALKSDFTYATDSDINGLFETSSSI